MHLNPTPKPEQPQLDPAHFQAPGQGFVQDHEVVHLVLPRPELFQHPDVLHRTVDGVDGAGELDLPR